MRKTVFCLSSLSSVVFFLFFRLFLATGFSLTVGGAEQVAAEDFIAGYHVEARVLILAESLETADGKLKPFASMSPREIATIYHELWHAYFLECETPKQPGARGGELYEAFRAKTDQLYADAPPGKRMEIQEEAVADFIDAVIETTVQMKRFLAAKTPEKRDAARKDSRYLGVYARLFQEKYQGYYTKTIHSAANGKDAAQPSPAPVLTPAPEDRLTSFPAACDRPTSSGAAAFPLFDSETTRTGAARELAGQAGLARQAQPYGSDAKTVLTGFIRDARAFGLPVRYLESAAGKLRGVVFIQTKGGTEAPQSEVVWAKESLGPADLDMVARVLFEGILTADPQEVFGEKRFAN